MFTITESEDRFKIYALEDNAVRSVVKVAPERGGIITSFQLDGQEILYMDNDRFYDTTQYVRGGIPILFPTCGLLDNNEYTCDGIKYNMENHGLARNYPWKVIETNTDGEASIKIRLDSNEETKKAYPFDFSLVFNYVLKKNKLYLYQEYKNNSDKSMPIYPGFHPYFQVNDKSKIEYCIQADKYFDYEDMKVKDYNNVELKNLDMSKIFLNVKNSNVSFYQQSSKIKIRIEYSSNFKYIVLWSAKDDYICVEPWTARPNSLNTKEDLIYVQPHQVFKSYIAISAEQNI